MTPDTFEQKSDVIVGHLLKEVLMTPSPLAEVCTDVLVAMLTNN
jgi:hypothetical protein